MPYYWVLFTEKLPQPIWQRVSTLKPLPHLSRHPPDTPGHQHMNKSDWAELQVCAHNFTSFLSNPKINPYQCHDGHKNIDRSISRKLWKHPVRRAESGDRGNINSWTGHACLRALPPPTVPFLGPMELWYFVSSSYDQVILMSMDLWYLQMLLLDVNRAASQVCWINLLGVFSA